MQDELVSVRFFLSLIGITQFLGNLLTPKLLVHVCDDSYGCSLCDGGEENITLTGVAGWNHVMCEQIGSSIKITTAADDLSGDDTKLGVCEIEILSQPGLTEKKFHFKFL